MAASPQTTVPPRKLRRGAWFRLKRIVLGLAIVIVALAGAGLVYQTIATAKDEREFPPPGKLVDIGGRTLHIQCSGTAPPGVATVILEAGTGLASPSWALVQELVAPTTRVCAYDRAGNGWSEPGPLPRDAATIAGELQALLKGAAIGGPYVLVGHSFGGMYIRAYRDSYPDEVVGLVLVDLSHPDQLARSPERSAQVATAEVALKVAPWLARLGIIRLTGLGEGNDLDLPARQHAEMNAFGASPSSPSSGWPSYRLCPRRQLACTPRQASAPCRYMSSRLERTQPLTGLNCRESWRRCRRIAFTARSRRRTTLRCYSAMRERKRRARQSLRAWKPLAPAKPRPSSAPRFYALAGFAHRVQVSGGRTRPTRRRPPMAPPLARPTSCGTAPAAGRTRA